MTQGLSALKELRAPPETALVKLEEALLALLDAGDGRGVELHELGAFWEKVEKGNVVDAMKPLGNRASVGMVSALVDMEGRVPPQVRDALAKMKKGDGSLDVDAAMDQFVDVLNSDNVVTKVQKLVGDGGNVLTKIEAFKDDGRVQAALNTLASDEMESKIMAGIESMDPNKLLEDAELALTDREARQRIINSMKDACLEFLLQYLPSMPIPPIDGEKDMME